MYLYVFCVSVCVVCHCVNTFLCFYSQTSICKINYLERTTISLFVFVASIAVLNPLEGSTHHWLLKLIVQVVCGLMQETNKMILLFCMFTLVYYSDEAVSSPVFLQVSGLTE